jgi:hypothetical protein
MLEVESQREDNARTRFLTDAELLRLTYGDLDLDLAAGTAYLRTTRNGQPRVLPVVRAVVADIKRHGGKAADARLFAAKCQPDKAMTFSTMWRTAVK